jgi:hypothetical protein
MEDRMRIAVISFVAVVAMSACIMGPLPGPLPGPVPNGGGARPPAPPTDSATAPRENIPYEDCSTYMSAANAAVMLPDSVPTKGSDYNMAMINYNQCQMRQSRRVP